jgi:hypothetical protein
MLKEKLFLRKIIQKIFKDCLIKVEAIFCMIIGGIIKIFHKMK